MHSLFNGVGIVVMRFSRLSSFLKNKKGSILKKEVNLDIFITTIP
jgi:hypothetical protein